MKRNLFVARELLELVEQQGDLDGLTMSDLLSLHAGRHGASTAADRYQLTLLVGDGYLARTGGGGEVPVRFQLTWSGHDLLEKLRSDKSLKMLDL